jgi:hypothetical protein
MSTINIRKALLIIVCFAIPACGGGGKKSGGSRICKSYCSSACIKTANCGFIPHAGVNTCTDTCFKASQEDGTSDDSCQQAATFVLSANCNQLGTLLGFRTMDRAHVEPLPSTDDVGDVLAQAAQGALGDLSLAPR